MPNFNILSCFPCARWASLTVLLTTSYLLASPVSNLTPPKTQIKRNFDCRFFPSAAGPILNCDETDNYMGISSYNFHFENAAIQALPSFTADTSGAYHQIALKCDIHAESYLDIDEVYFQADTLVDTSSPLYFAHVYPIDTTQPMQLGFKLKSNDLSLQCVLWATQGYYRALQPVEPDATTQSYPAEVSVTSAFYPEDPELNNAAMKALITEITTQTPYSVEDNESYAFYSTSRISENLELPIHPIANSAWLIDYHQGNDLILMPQNERTHIQNAIARTRGFQSPASHFDPFFLKAADGIGFWLVSSATTGNPYQDLAQLHQTLIDAIDMACHNDHIDTLIWSSLGIHRFSQIPHHQVIRAILHASYQGLNACKKKFPQGKLSIVADIMLDLQPWQIRKLMNEMSGLNIKEHLIVREPLNFLPLSEVLGSLTAIQQLDFINLVAFRYPRYFVHQFLAKSTTASDKMLLLNALMISGYNNRFSDSAIASWFDDLVAIYHSQNADEKAAFLAALQVKLSRKQDDERPYRDILRGSLHDIYLSYGNRRN